MGALRRKGVSEIWRIWIGEKRMAPLRFLRFIFGVGKDLMVYLNDSINIFFDQNYKLAE